MLSPMRHRRGTLTPPGAPGDGIEDYSARILLHRRHPRAMTLHPAPAPPGPWHTTPRRRFYTTPFVAASWYPAIPNPGVCLGSGPNCGLNSNDVGRTLR